MNTVFGWIFIAILPSYITCCITCCIGEIATDEVSGFGIDADDSLYIKILKVLATIILYCLPGVFFIIINIIFAHVEDKKEEKRLFLENL